MIERKFVAQNIKEHQIEEYIAENLKRVGHSHTKVQRTPLGEKIIIFASRPGLIVGRKGQSIKKLTEDLKRIFKLENPQIEISEVENQINDAQIVAEKIANSLEKFGASKFKAIGHKTMEEVINSGALGIEILISGKIPSSRAKSWRFYQGYLKKCGDVAFSGVHTAYARAELKTGTVGIIVKIMPADTKLPDDIEIKNESEQAADAAAETVKTAEKAAEKAVKESRSKEKKKEPAKKQKKEKATEKAAAADKSEKNGKDKEKGTKSAE